MDKCRTCPTRWTVPLLACATVRQLVRPVAHIPARPERKRGQRPKPQKDRNAESPKPDSILVIWIDIGKSGLDQNFSMFGAEG